jgi:short-subunit dehydrogenase
VAEEIGPHEGIRRSVINIASIGGYSVEPDIGFYNVTKAALLHVTRQLVAEEGRWLTRCAQAV